MSRLRTKRNIKKIENILKRKDISSFDYQNGLLILNLLKKQLKENVK